MAKHLRAQNGKESGDRSTNTNRPNKSAERSVPGHETLRPRVDQAPFSPSDAAQLQRTIGNQAIGRLGRNSGSNRSNEDDQPSDSSSSLRAILNNSAAVASQALNGSKSVIQPKLTLGPVGDKYEQEADQVAKQVVGRLSPGKQGGTPDGPQSTRRQEEEEELQARPVSNVQRQEEEEVLQAKLVTGILRQEEEEELQARSIPNVRRQEEEEELQAKPISLLRRQEEVEEMAQAKSTADGGAVTRGVEEAIQSSRGNGRPLSDGIRAPMENAFGADFSDVKVHTDDQSDALNESLQARAFTTGQDVFFRQGEYSPGSSSGQELLAHELTHVVQQNGSQVRRVSDTIQRQKSRPFKHLLKLGEHYKDETTTQRPGLLGAAKSLPRVIKFWYTKKTELETAAPPEQAAIRAKVKQVLTNAKRVPADIDTISLDDLKALVAAEHTRAYQHAVRQDIEVEEDGTFDESSLAGRMVQYDSKERQAASKVTISGGTFYRRDGTVVDTGDSVTMHSGPGYEIFVMNPYGDIHMASHKIGKFHHSSLLAGAPVALGGEMVVTGGILKLASNKSGHYVPSDKHFRQFLHLLEKKGVNMDFEIAGFGLPSNQTAQQYLATLPEEETYEFEKTETTYLWFEQKFGTAAVQAALAQKGWTTPPGSKHMVDSSNNPVSHKTVRKWLRMKFGVREGWREERRELKAWGVEVEESELIGA